MSAEGSKNGLPGNHLRGQSFIMNDSGKQSSSYAEVTQQVQEFYDRYPYPPPVDSLDRYRLAWQDPVKRRADYHLFWPDRGYQEDLSVLIAGCGTTQAAKHALRSPAARVTAIDFSLASVQSTEELKRKYDLNNLQVYQLPIDRVKELRLTFDQIVCTGVLHHLADPDAGLAALRSVLKPDGAMHLMVYAPYGRTGIYMLQEFCRRIGIRATDDGISDLISVLGALPPGHPLETVLREAPDFRQEAALADALLHPQDRAYSVPQLFDFLKAGKLTFGRWVRQAPYSAHCGLMARLPHVLRLAQLPPAEQFAAAELFRGTMVRHSVIAYRNESPSRPISFAGDAWTRYVPIRMSETICVQDRLAKPVLINQNHTNTDLLMPVDATEKRMVDAIDGQRTLNDILETVLSSSRGLKQENVRDFFERLWWHDQVVFDASRL